MAIMLNGNNIDTVKGIEKIVVNNITVYAKPVESSYSLRPDEFTESTQLLDDGETHDF